MLLDAAESQLVLVDYQPRLMPAIAGGPALLANAVRLANIARLMAVPAWGTEQNPARLGESLPEIRALCDDTLAKTSFSAVHQGLLERLRPVASASAAPRGGNARSLPKQLRQPEAPPRNSVVIAGCEAHVCLLQTALDLQDEEFDVWVVTDACGSRTERNRDAAFDRLAAAGAELVSTEMVAFEWMRSCEHAQFKAVQALIK